MSVKNSNQNLKSAKLEDKNLDKISGGSKISNFNLNNSKMKTTNCKNCGKSFEYYDDTFVAFGGSYGVQMARDERKQYCKDCRILDSNGNITRMRPKFDPTTGKLTKTGLFTKFKN